MRVVEFLSFYRLVFCILPRLLWQNSAGAEQYFYIDASKLAKQALRIVGRLAPGLVVPPLSFRLIEIRDAQGLLIRLRVAYKDLFDVQQDALTQPIFSEFLNEADNAGLRTFLSKQVVQPSFSDRRSVWRALLLIEICAFAGRRRGAGEGIILFLNSRPWLHVIERYANRLGVKIVPWYSMPQRSDLHHSLLPPWVFLGLQSARNRLFHLRFFPERGLQIKKHPPVDSAPKLGLEFIGQLNLSRPECHSDFFFWQRSSIPGSDLVVTCGLPQDPVDEKKLAEFSKYSITPIATHSLGTTLPTVKMFTTWPTSISRYAVPARYRTSGEGKWIDRHARQYFAYRDYWRELFYRSNVRLFVTWQRFDAVHCAIADAMRNLGGVTAVYQKALQVDPAPEITVNADVMFGYSTLDAQIEKRSGSQIAYHVATGYLGDHRAALVRDMAREVRSKLQRNGAAFIFAFFDENSSPDERWHTGQRFQAENYEFLLQKVLSESWFGLIIKPKVPATLRRRLGPVASLLERALQTGRCHLYESGTIQGSYPPVLAALAADVALHGHLCAGTAGLESALAGVRSLLLDREGWHVSPLYKLGVGRVVFRTWTELWEAMIEFRKSPGSVPAFGDWSSMLKELDPFRDGRAADRMGMFLNWLLQGLKAGQDRDVVMANAAERYGQMWGYDKITQVNHPTSLHPQSLEVI